MCQHLTVARVAEGLGVSWHTANSAILAEGKRVLIEDPSRFNGVAVIGLDEHVWRHTRRGDKYVTVIIDLTPVRDRTGPARLLDMVEGRSKQVFKTWIAGRPKAWRDGIEVVAMDGFTGFKTAAAEELPDAVEIMDPFHVVRLAGDALDRCRQRVQQQTIGHRGRSGDPLYAARRTLHTGHDLLTDKQKDRLEALFVADDHAEVESTWGVYQRVIAAYREPDGAQGKQLIQALIGAVSTGVPASLTEVITLGRTETPCRGRARILRPTRHQQQSRGSTQRQARTPPRLRPRLPEPCQLHRPITARGRRIQAPITPPNAMSP